MTHPTSPSALTPALRTRLAHHLAALPLDPVQDALAHVAATSAATLLAQGWEPAGAPYDLGAYPGDREAAADLLGRPLSHVEAVALEACIREVLAAAGEQ